MVFLLALAGYLLLRLRGETLARDTPPPRDLPWFTVLGLGAGSLGGLFGVGGGVLATPALTSLFGLSQVAAQGAAWRLADCGAFPGA